MARILAVDDESAILEVIKKGLEKDGHTVQTYTSAKEIDMKQMKHYEMLLLDVMMPDVDGFAFCRKVRENVDYPIIFLTAKTMEQDITYGLGIGADDYLMKPFRIAELRARVNAHLRREKREHHHVLNFGGLTIDMDACVVSMNGEAISFTKSEYLICEFLARNKGQVFSREQIYEAVFDVFGESDSTTIATHIKNIRAKLGRYQIQPIKTVWGIGYKWQQEEE